MEITLALLAEAANSTVDGKLNIHAAFTALGFEQFPATVPKTVLVLRFEIGDADWGAQQWLTVTIYDGDEQVVTTTDASVNLPADPATGQPVSFFQLFQFLGLTYTSPGEYEVVVEVNDEPKESVLLTVGQVEPPPSE
ncbi:MAG TPA: hypothetical protein QGF05_14030 [Dehalococcoidia bacterium]|nr:hypothetical protein [Dehalococcoidia bacterium]